MSAKDSQRNTDQAILGRRAFLGATLLAGGSLLVNMQALAQLSLPGAASRPYSTGKLLKILPFYKEIPLRAGELFSSGLEGRLYTDVSSLSSESLITPTNKFYVRTSCPDLIDYNTPWKLKVTTSADDRQALPIEKVEAMSKDMGIHLMECSGNERSGQYGLMSTCRWDGVPVSHLLKSLNFHPNAERICIAGFDSYLHPSGTSGLRRSIPGASWIFTLEELRSSGAFFATKMNGEPLPKDHGYPVRLVVPGWYGCTCIKWVNEISFVEDDAPATSQMKEFAGRTDQDGTPELARDYKPAIIDQAAMPIRVEQWSVDGHIRYNVVGIVWGGHQLTRDLQIRFQPNEPFAKVESHHHKSNSTWSLWSHTWTPERIGVYQIHLKIGDATIRAKRLDKGYYARHIEITEV